MSRSQVAYLNPKGSRITFESWKAISTDKYNLRQFKNDRVELLLHTKRKVSRIHEVPQEHWRRWAVIVMNLISKDAITGEALPVPKRVPDPDASKEFRTLEEATAHFEKFLAKYTESHFDEETGALVEVGNELAPPDPDKPTMVETSPAASDFGSW